MSMQAAPSFPTSFPQIFGDEKKSKKIRCLIPCAIDQVEWSQLALGECVLLTDLCLDVGWGLAWWAVFVATVATTACQVSSWLCLVCDLCCFIFSISLNLHLPSSRGLGLLVPSAQAFSCHFSWWCSKQHGDSFGRTHISEWQGMLHLALDFRNQLLLKPCFFLLYRSVPLLASVVWYWVQKLCQDICKLHMSAVSAQLERGSW